MCGMAGWVSYGGNLKAQRDVITAMTKTMACRGPDAGGVYIDRHVGLGHRRLAVIDLAGGVQPMEVEEADHTTVSLIYTGEVYNFMELRDQLRLRDHRFKTSSDTEVVLHAYLQWGEKLAERLNGMFAFAIWDGQTEELFLVRDRLGVKPLFYYPTPDGVLFGSEPKAILAHPTVQPRVNRDGLREILVLAKNPEATIYAGMREVRPGQVVRVSRSGLTKRRYWTLTAHEHEDDLPRTIRTVTELLEDIVQRQIVADVPLCSLLSGGLDSSSITALAHQAIARQQGGRLRSFSVDFADHGAGFVANKFHKSSDAPFVRDFVEHVGCKHTEVVLDSKELAKPDLNRAVTQASDFPLSVSGDIMSSLYRLFQAVRVESTVALSGESADEVGICNRPAAFQAAVLTMTRSASETLIRYLGPSEAYFWLSNQNSWKHFVVAAQITGETTTASWRTALDAVQRRHPLLGVCIDKDDSGAPYFRLLPESRIPLQIVPGDALQGWEDEMETELSTPFPVEDALLVRAVLLHEAHRATILLTVHHSIADGLSVALIVRDILEALSGKPLEALPVPQPQEDLCPPPTIQSTELGSEEPEAPAPPNAPGTLLKRDRSLLRVRGLRLPAELSDRLRERSRREGTTVHGALAAALVFAGRDIHREWREAPVRVVSPVNNRTILGRGDDCALSIIFPVGSYNPKSPIQFWEIARSVRNDLADMRTPGGLSAVFSGFDQLISSKPGVQGIAQFELQVCACEMMVSNLGVLPFEADFGDLRLEALWGPSVFVGIEGEQMIGAATVRGAIHLLHSSYTPIASLLETTEQVLRVAVS